MQTVQWELVPSFAKVFSGLKREFLIGEALSVRDGDYILENTSGIVFDAFGSSEAGFFAYCRVKKGQAVVLEYPTYGVKLTVLNSEGKPVKEGEYGELCIGGTLTKYGGYLGHPELTQSKFRELPGYGRIFFSGDSAVIEPGGYIRMTGRLDSMKKIHGQRLEPREIEIAIESFKNIRQAAVDVRGEGKDAVLCAWYTVSETVDETELRNHLSATLPAYMVPARMMKMDEMPLNTSGKLNRRVLPDINASKQEYEKPCNETEAILCQAYQEILRCSEPVGRNDNFFLLGGDSILGMQLAALIQNKLDRQYSISDLFRRPTPALLAEYEPNVSQDNTVLSKTYIGTIPAELKSISDDENTQACFPVGVHTASYLLLNKIGLKGALNEERIRVLLNCAWTEKEFRDRVSFLTKNHPALRSYFVPDKRGRQWQLFLKNYEPALWYKDISALSPDAAERFINGFWQVISQDKGA